MPIDFPSIAPITPPGVIGSVRRRLREVKKAGKKQSTAPKSGSSGKLPETSVLCLLITFLGSSSSEIVMSASQDTDYESGWTSESGCTSESSLASSQPEP